jgi:hypothetical protein
MASVIRCWFKRDLVELAEPGALLEERQRYALRQGRRIGLNQSRIGSLLPQQEAITFLT